METRQITEVKMYMLVLNPMQASKIEAQQLAGWADTREKMVAWYEAQMVETYKDGDFSKNFKKDGPLEWFNPVNDINEINSWGQGIHEQWVPENDIPHMNAPQV